MSNKNKTKNKFLSGLLAATSLATLTLASTSASAGAITVRTNTAADNFVLSTGVGLNKTAGSNDNVPFASGSALSIVVAKDGSTGDLGTASQIFNIAYVNVGKIVPGPFTVSLGFKGSALSFGSIFETTTDAIKADNAFKITLADAPTNQTIILNGLGTSDGTKLNDYTGLGIITFAADKAQKLIVSGAQASANTPKMAYITLAGLNAGAADEGKAVDIANATASTFQVGGALNSLGLQDVNTYLTVQSKKFTTFKTIAIADGSTLVFDGSEAIGDNTLTFASAANQTITFGTSGDGTLVLKTKLAVKSYSIGDVANNTSSTTFGGATDLQGNIVFDNIANLVGNLTSANGNNVIGTSATSRAKSFTVIGGSGDITTINKNVFAKGLILAGGKIDFTAAVVVANTPNNVDVGADGTTKFTTLTGAKDANSGIAIKNDMPTFFSLATPTNLGTVTTDGSANAMLSTIITTKKLSLSGGDITTPTQISSITANALNTEINIGGAWKLIAGTAVNAGLKANNFTGIVFNLKNASIDGTITTLAADTTLNFSGVSNKVSSDIGTVVNKFAITIDEGEVSLSGNTYANLFKFTTKAARAVIAAGKNISISVTTDTNQIGDLSFQGDSKVVGNIGAKDKTLNSVTIAGQLTVDSNLYTKDLILGGKATGTNASTVIFSVANSPTTPNTVNTTNLTLAGAATLPANTTTYINGGIINLKSYGLTISGNAECAKDTKISTTLTGTGIGTLGNIVVDNNGTLKLIDTKTPVTLTVNDTITLGSATYKFITATDKAINEGQLIDFPIDETVKTNNAYSKWIIIKSKTGYDLSRTNNAEQTIRDEVKAFGGSDTVLTNALALSSAKSGDALATISDIANINNQAERYDAIVRVAADGGAQANNAINTVGAGVQTALITRTEMLDMENDRGYAVPNGTVEKPATAAGDYDKVSGTQMGIWVQPYYVQSKQKTQKDVSGYNAKSTGGIIGLDTNANDNLIVGGAVSFVGTKMKYSGFKQGDKATVNTMLFSLYMDQQLVKDFSVQAIATFGSSTIKSKSQRRVAVTGGGSAFQMAQGSYDSTYFGGQAMLSYYAKLADAVLLTPQLGLRYSSSSSASYTETGTTTQNRVVSSSKASTNLQAIIGAKVQTTYQSQDMLMTPEVHAFLYQSLSSTTGKVNAQLNGMSTPLDRKSVV